MKCPKTGEAMELVNYGREFKVYRAIESKGIWFPGNSHEELRDEWMSQSIDIGDPQIGKKLNQIKSIQCPICGEAMSTVADKKQPHIEYEFCIDGHGAFFDAGEFTDYKEDTVSDFFKTLRVLIEKARIKK